MSFAAKRTAAFLRLLAQELVPQNKIWELVQRVDRAMRYTSNDFTGTELAMANMIGITDEEIDGACSARIAEHKKAAEKERQRAEACCAYWSAEAEKADGYRLANMHLEKAFKELGVVPPDPEAKAAE